MDDFTRGYMCAVAVFINAHEDISLAADILISGGMSEIDCTDLDEMDTKQLQKLKDELGIRLIGL